MIRTLALRELRSLFLSPLAWAILAVVLFLLAWLFLAQVEYFQMVQPRLVSIPNAPGITAIVVAPMLGDAAIILMLVAPLLTMRLIADERRNHTLPLLLSSPISMTEIVLGKYLGLLLFFLILLALIALMPLSLLMGGGLDFGTLAAGFLGLALLLAAYSAAGLFMSSLTRQPTVAAISTFGLLLLLWVIDWAGNARPGMSGVFTYLSLLRHYESLLKGLFNTKDVLYYLLFITTFLVLSIRRLDADRLQH
ncbi:ABC-2 family transporter protein [bacterium BMS3Bbin12]|nr:ABC-2 family transporter protein [bacterium BMS3Abin12]GBE46916.1 ABC-2 family transporter protein [bacterium BMS3Bbin12]GBE50615.1 ABC-2 family transporter protein [bacterium BMS3Bbin13]HDK02854.1 ABC transporter permease [Gammaproteobacteria bacterium]HDO33903.1 ABC transporter permease [Chromatiales bacterium]